MAPAKSLAERFGSNAKMPFPRILIRNLGIYLKQIYSNLFKNLNFSYFND